MHLKLIQSRRGFTLIELLIGLVVTAIVLSALAAFTFAVSENWVRGDESQSVFLSQTIAVGRLTSILRPASAVLQSTGPTCLIWNGDANGDGKVQLSETLQLRFDPSSHTVLVDRPFPTTWAPGLVVQYDTAMSPPSTMTPSAITNSAYYTSSALIRNVENCQFSPVASPDGIQSPSVEIVLTLNSGNQNVSPQTFYSTVTLRAPNSNPQ